MIFETLNAYQQSAALRGAIELDLFTGIAAGQGTLDQLVEHCRADRRALRILCDFLVVHGFLLRGDEGYRLSPTAAKFLDRRSPAYMGSIARFVNSDDLLAAFHDVAELVRRGKTLLDGSGTATTDYDGWVEFAHSMAPMMVPAAEFLGELAARLFPGPARVLDIAAGHGLFGVSVARHNPGATIVALDWERVLAVASSNAYKAGVGDRHALLPGDALQVDYGTGYDIVLVTNFFHHFDQDKCLHVMRKIHDSLSPEGIVLTLEFVPNEDRVSPPVAATFALVMLGTTHSGDAYTFSEYNALWKRAGLSVNELLDVPNSPQRVIVSRRS
ncbi:MAG: SAM-dependent methyltransferase [Planctomycetales bacterium]